MDGASLGVLRCARPELRGDEVTSNAGGTNVGKARRDAPLTSCPSDFRGISDRALTVMSVLDCNMLEAIMYLQISRIDHHSFAMNRL